MVRRNGSKRGTDSRKGAVHLTTYKKRYCYIWVEGYDEEGVCGVYHVAEDEVEVAYRDGIIKAIYVTFHEYIHVIIAKCHLPWQLDVVHDRLNIMLHKEHYVYPNYQK